MKTSKLNVLAMSDVHLGHPRNPAANMVKNLLTIFADTPANRDLDIIFFAGDVFDGNVSLNEEALSPIIIFAEYLLRFCKKNDIVLRFLEGTPSHDCKQPALFTILNEDLGIGADVKYFENLEHEHIERFGIDVLYIPDEWRHDCADTFKDVQRVMKTSGVDKFHFIVMHGVFPHQVAQNAQHAFTNLHKHEDYLPIAIYAIFNGHIHTPSKFKHLVAQGSTDRCAHGEEHDKGYWRVTVMGHTVKFMFCVNKGAMPFETHDVTEMSYEEVKRLLLAKATEFEGRPARVRLRFTKTHVLKTVFEDLREKFPGLSLSKDIVSTDEVKPQVVIKDIRSTMTKACLRPETMANSLMEFIQENVQLPPDIDLDYANHHLQEILSGCHS